MYCRSSWTWLRPWHSCGQLPRACRQFMVGEIARTSQRVQDASNVQLRMVLTAKERRREETGAEQPTTNIEPAFVELRAGRHPEKGQTGDWSGQRLIQGGCDCGAVCHLRPRSRSLCGVSGHRFPALARNRRIMASSASVALPSVLVARHRFPCYKCPIEAAGEAVSTVKMPSL